MMTLNPEIVKRAQVGLDELTHGERTITLKDRSKLPYIDCILKETYRYVDIHIAILLLKLSILGYIHRVLSVGRICA